jgi:hypothetical protein
MQTKRIHHHIAFYSVGMLLGVFWLIPLIWMVGTAFTEATFTMSLFPTTKPTLANLSYVWNSVPFGRYYLNTLSVVVVTYAVQFVTVTLAAYALAVLKFKGEKIIFLIIFIQIIIPNDVLISPNYMMLADLGLTDTKLGILVEADVQDRSCGTGRSRGDRWLQSFSDHHPCLCAEFARGLSLLRLGFGQLPLEQLPLAVDCDEFTGEPHAHRRFGTLRQIQGGRDAVGQCLCRHVHHQCSACDRILHLPEKVHQ